MGTRLYRLWMVLAILASVGLVCPPSGIPGHSALPSGSPLESTSLARHAENGALLQLAKKLCSRQERTSPPKKAPWDGDGPGPEGIPVAGPTHDAFAYQQGQVALSTPGPSRPQAGLAPDEGGRRGPPADAQV